MSLHDPLRPAVLVAVVLLFPVVVFLPLCGVVLLLCAALRREVLRLCAVLRLRAALRLRVEELLTLRVEERLTLRVEERDTLRRLELRKLERELER